VSKQASKQGKQANKQTGKQASKQSNAAAAMSRWNDSIGYQKRLQNITRAAAAAAASPQQPSDVSTAKIKAAAHNTTIMVHVYVPFRWSSSKNCSTSLLSSSESARDAIVAVLVAVAADALVVGSSSERVVRSSSHNKPSFRLRFFGFGAVFCVFFRFFSAFFRFFQKFFPKNNQTKPN
jgi:hypothetical protein